LSLNNINKVIFRDFVLQSYGYILVHKVPLCRYLSIMKAVQFCCCLQSSKLLENELFISYVTRVDYISMENQRDMRMLMCEDGLVCYNY